MANSQVPGFVPQHGAGGMSIELVRKRVLTNNATAIFYGDAVDNTSAGDVVVNASTSVDNYSVAQGASFFQASDNSRIERKHLPAGQLYTSTAIDPFNASYVYCVEDMVNTRFLASVDEAMALTDLGINYAMVLGTGSTTTGMSAHELDFTGRGTTATLPWRVLDFDLGTADMGYNDISAADARVICKQNAGNREPALEPGGSLGT